MSPSSPQGARVPAAAPLASPVPSVGQQDADSGSQLRGASQRREKAQLSCTLCRRRNHDARVTNPNKPLAPCSNCSSRGLMCTYVDNSANTSSMKPAAMHKRIVQLERLVMSLMPESAQRPSPNSNPEALPSPGGGRCANQANAQLASTSDVPMDVRSEAGSMRVSASELHYVGGDHWAAIMDNIADLKDHFDREEQIQLAQDDVGDFDGEDSITEPQSSHVILLYGYPAPRSKAEILAALPPKNAVDRYISRFFNRLDLTKMLIERYLAAIIHGPNFLREYEAFWANPSSVPVMWLGLLFSMLCLALVASDPADTAHGDPEQRSLQINLYREKTVQCLVLGEYTKSGPYVLETFINYVYIELCLRGDADKDIWSLFALEVNLAMRGGYHRDPSRFANLSPLQSEMRRRLWATVLQGDILISSQMGMPRMISDWKYDTVEPLNLSDADLDENSNMLPPSRPETEHTVALGIIARRRMFVALGSVLDITAAVRMFDQADIMRVDAILHKAAASVPPPLQPKPMAASMTDSQEIIMSRLFIRHLFFKGQIMLHCRFLHTESPSPQEDIFAYSRTSCLDAALGALQIQQIIDEETRPGGQLYMMRWRVSSIMNHTFLTATMILCSMLHRKQMKEREEELLTALRRARIVWMRASSSSQEAKKAADTVSIVIARAGGAYGQGQPEISGSGPEDAIVEGQTAPHTYSQANSIYDIKEDTDDQAHKPDDANVTVFDFNSFISRGVLGTFTSPEQGEQMYNFAGNSAYTDMMLDEWMESARSDII
ncbi:Fusarisetin A cluster transcription factor fsa6 [Paramyrothecium foliicola]|nr:Fusarisetin A cluster transcription factor fsa6 [Paramyrothecium foliicola]